VTPVAVGAVQPVRRWSTLALLKGTRMAILALDCLLLLAVVLGTQVHRAAMQTVGRDTARKLSRQTSAKRRMSSLASSSEKAARPLHSTE